MVCRQKTEQTGMVDRSSLDLDTLDFAKGGGLVTVVAQDAVTGAVLMVAHADREALERTIATGEMHYHSHTRGLWHKGATSGHTQRVIALVRDCDGDAVLARVVPRGPACHTGATSCFAQGNLASDTLSALAAVIDERASRVVPHVHGVRSSDGSKVRSSEGTPSANDAAGATRAHSGDASPHPSTPRPSTVPSSYTVRLLEDRNLRLKKLGEEAAELVLACADGDTGRATEEMADLIYHALVALHAAGGSLTAVQGVLAERSGCEL